MTWFLIFLLWLAIVVCFLILIHGGSKKRTLTPFEEQLTILQAAGKLLQGKEK